MYQGSFHSSEYCEIHALHKMAEVGDCHSRIHRFQNRIASFSRGEVLLILDKILSCQTFAGSHTSVWRKRYFGSTSDFLDFASYRKKYKSAESLNAVFGNDLPKGTL